MSSAYVVAVIGAVAGLVTGFGSALIALLVARYQAKNAQDLQRRQWTVDTLRDCYSQVGSTHRQLMLAWWDWWHALNARHQREQHAEILQALGAFEAACTAVRILAPVNVVQQVEELKAATDAFDRYAEDHSGPEGWEEPYASTYEQLQKNADAAMPSFIKEARKSIEKLLGDQLAKQVRSSGASDEKASTGPVTCDGSRRS